MIKMCILEEGKLMDITLKAVIEGIIFVFGEEGISLTQLSEALDLEEEYIRNILEEMIVDYQHENCGFELISIQDRYKFISKAAVHDYVQRIITLTKSRQLSQSALETLAIIAYKQPITRMDIEDIRGVGCEMMLKKLQAQDLIREAGRSESAGRPFLYEITEEFLDLFKLMSLNELPNLPTYQEESSEHQLFE